MASGKLGSPAPYSGAVAKLAVYPGPDLYARERPGKM